MASGSKNKQQSFSKEELRFLAKIGRRVHKDLYDLGKPVEWLAWEAGLSRATVRRILDANRNVGVLTLQRVAKGLGYKDLAEFMASL